MIKSGLLTQRLFLYRYAEGLILASNSADQLKAFDPSRLAKEELKPALPENELHCRPAQIAESMRVLSTAVRFLLGPNIQADMDALAAVLKPIGEMRLTILVGKDTVEYHVVSKANP